MELSTAAAAFLIGLVSGLRAFTGLLALVWSYALGWLDAASAPFGFIDSWLTRVLVTILALGEYVGDKLPSAPDRTAIPGLLARILLGGFSGWCLGQGREEFAVYSAVLAAIGAVLGAFGGLHLRRRVPGWLGVKDAWVGAAEDIIALAGSFAIIYLLSAA